MEIEEEIKVKEKQILELENEILNLDIDSIEAHKKDDIITDLELEIEDLKLKLGGKKKSFKKR